MSGAKIFSMPVNLFNAKIVSTKIFSSKISGAKQFVPKWDPIFQVFTNNKKKLTSYFTGNFRYHFVYYKKCIRHF